MASSDSEEITRRVPAFGQSLHAELGGTEHRAMLVLDQIRSQPATQAQYAERVRPTFDVQSAFG